MTIQMRGSMDDFNAFLSRFQNAAPAAVVRGLRDGANILVGKAVELTPVDQSQMKGSWRNFPTSNGAIVTNLAQHAAFVERGRGPGPVPSGPILAWMGRHGIPEDALFAIMRKLARSGYEAKWPLKNAIIASKAAMGKAILRSLRDALKGGGSGGANAGDGGKTSMTDEAGNTKAGHVWVKKHMREDHRKGMGGTRDVRGHWRKVR